MRNTLRCFALFLALVLAFGLSSCAKYPMVSSSEEEKATVFTVDGEYKAPYELYRFAFLNALRAKGDMNGWGEAEKKAAFDECDAIAREEIARIYTVFSLCEKQGIDPYSREIDKSVEKAVENVIDDEISGFGDHDAYLKALRESYMNDSVFRLYMRLDICEERLARTMQLSSFVKEDDETVKAYFMSDATVRATWIYISYTSAAYDNHTDAMWNDLVERAKAASNEDFIAMAQGYLLGDLYHPDELEAGFYFGKHQLDAYYEALTETAFSLAEGESSELIHSGDGVYIVRRLPKDNAYIENEENMELLREYYLLDCFYRVIDEESERILGTLVPEAAYGGITLDSVKMGE